jgi:hypothetical protein
MTKKLSKALSFVYFICGLEVSFVPLIMPDPLKLIFVHHLPLLPLEEGAWYWLNYAEQFMNMCVAIPHFM